MSKDQAVFNFDLEETLFFEKGQEVSEMLSVSLDPEISIKTFDDYVSIRGVIKLHGEYQKIEQINKNEEEPLNLQDHHSRRYLEEIEDIENGNTVFTHHFPIEISIPSYRVVDLNDISVKVDAFDYELPDDSQLKISSVILINGINQHVDLSRETIEIREVEEDIQTELIEDSFDFEIKNEVKTKEVLQDDIVLEEVVERKEENKVDVDVDVDVDDDRWKKEKTQTFEEFFEKENAESNFNENNEENKEVIEDIMSEEVQTSVAEAEIETEEDQRPIEKSVEEEESGADNIDYMARMFSDKDDESSQTYAQMRLCIVQETDTLESIAERYKVPKLQLLKQNRLEGDDLIEGQLLSIPLKR